MKRLGIAMLAVMLSACTTVKLFLANAPTYFATSFSWQRDVAYGTEPWQKLDLYTPKGVMKGAVVFFYPGGWTKGDKADYRFVAATLAQAGYQVLIPNYRKFPPHVYPSFQQDAALAVQYAHGLGPEKLVIFGHSAGAHMAVLLVTDDAPLRELGLSKQDITAVVGLAGPYNFTPNDATLQKIFGPESRYPQHRANTFVTGAEPPMFLAHGGQDDVVAVANMKLLHSQLAANGHQRSTQKIYPGVDHIQILAPFSWAVSEPPVVADVLQFLDSF